MSYSDQRGRGSVQNLTAGLISSNVNEKKAAMKLIISAMTCGEDTLLTKIIQNMENNNLELKKLNYLYVISYAKTHPDIVILAINSFRKDALEGNNPILRALAIRTMGCIRVGQITEYLVEPLRSALKDEDSYVRKTGVICIAKLYESNPEMIERLGFIKMLENLLTDGNAMVVSNAIAVLGQISDMKGENLVNINDGLAYKLINALSEANEWGKTYILDAFAKYEPSSSRVAEEVLDRLSVNLSQGNPGIVLSTVRIIVKYMDYLSNNDVIRNYCSKVSQTLITLIGNSDHEFMYIVLKNISIIIQKRPLILNREIKIFFCSHNDPHYVKIEKLEVLLRLADDETIDPILLELKEYVTEVDIDFVRKCIRTLGRLAIKLEGSSDICVQALFECLKTKVNYVIQEAIIVMRDVFRRYPTKYERILVDLCKNISSIDEPEAKSAIIWIIGEYIEIIGNANKLLATYLEGFKEETTDVQLQIMTSCIKLLVIRPQEGGPLVKHLFEIIENSENPDLRDRGYFYWRMLGKNKDVATRVVSAQKPPISDMSYNFESNLLEKLVDGIGTLSGIYYKEPEAFVKILRESKNQKWEEREDDDNQEVIDSTGGTMGSYTAQAQNVDYNSGAAGGGQQPGQGKGGIDLLGDDDDGAPSQPQQNRGQAVPPQTQSNPFGGVDDDLLGDGPSNQGGSPSQPAHASRNIKIPMSTVLADSVQGMKNQRAGLKVSAAVQREGDSVSLYLELQNNTSEVLNNFGIKFDANCYKLQPTNVALDINSMSPGSTSKCRVPLDFGGKSNGQPPQTPYKVQVALNTSIDVFVFSVPVSYSVMLLPQAEPCTHADFTNLMNRPNQVSEKNSFPSSLSEDQIKQKFTNNNIVLVMSQRNEQGGFTMHNFYAKAVDGMEIGLRVVMANGNCNVNFQCPHPAVVPLFLQALKFINQFD